MPHSSRTDPAAVESHPYYNRFINLGDLPVPLAQKLWNIIETEAPAPDRFQDHNLGGHRGFRALPPELITQMDAVLASGQFRSYDQLAEWVNQRLIFLGMEDHQIKPTTLKTRATSVTARQKALKDAADLSVAIAAAVPEDDGTLAAAALMVAKSHIFKVLEQFDPEEINVRSIKDFNQLVRSLMDLMRATNDHNQNMEVVRKRVEAATDEVCKIAKDAGASDQVIKEISHKLLGIPLEESAL